MRYLELKEFIQEYPSVRGLGFEPLFFPGSKREEAYDQPDPTIILTLGGGAGFELEQTYDRVNCFVDVAGPQGDYDGAENFALAVDKAFVSITTPRNVGTSRVLACTRSGGRPAPLLEDDGDRSHFSCAYVFRVGSGN